MSDDVTGYDGEKLGEMRDYHDDSGSYLGTGFSEAKGCLEVVVLCLATLVLLVHLLLLLQLRGG